MADLLEPAEIILMPEDSASADLTARGQSAFLDVVCDHLDSPLCWAILAEAALADGTREGDLSAYAFATNGRERGLDIIFPMGWMRGSKIPWSHVPNQGLLRSWWALAVAAHRIGAVQERDWAIEIVQDSDPEAYSVLAGRLPLG